MIPNVVAISGLPNDNAVTRYTMIQHNISGITAISKSQRPRNSEILYPMIEQDDSEPVYSVSRPLLTQVEY